MKNYFLLMIVTLLFVTGLHAQLTIEGEFRTRAEYRDGYKTLPMVGDEALKVMSQRSRITFNYQKAKLETRIMLQDARIWGEDKWKTDMHGLGVKEAWAKYFFNPNVGFKIGRQTIIYDDGRLFASGDWRTYGESHDAAILILKSSNNFTAHFAYSVSNNPSAETDAFMGFYDLAETQYKSMSYFWLNKTFMDKKLNVSILGVQDGYQLKDSLTIKYRNTYGTYFKFAPNDISLSGAYYKQSGNSIDGKKIDADFCSALLSFKLMKTNKCWVAYDHYSGSDVNDPAFADETNTFNNLYGPGHKYLGHMDYFSIAGKHLAGINDLNIGIEWMLPNKIKLMAKYHMFSLDKEYLKKESIIKVDKALGSEVDLMLAKKFSDEVSIKVGYSFMSPTESMEILKQGVAGKSEFPQFAWIMVQVTPTFYKTDNRAANVVRKKLLKPQN